MQHLGHLEYTIRSHVYKPQSGAGISLPLLISRIVLVLDLSSTTGPVPVIMTLSSPSEPKAPVLLLGAFFFGGSLLLSNVCLRFRDNVLVAVRCFFGLGWSPHRLLPLSLRFVATLLGAGIAYSERSGLYFSLSLFTSLRQLPLTISDFE